MKIEGFNAKEQKLYNVLKDGKPHNIRELKKLFWADGKERCAVTYEKGWGESEIDSQAQSYVRNSVRRLVRDGWVKQTGRGTYQLSKKGAEWVKQGVTTTASAKKPKEKKVAKPKIKKEAKKAAKPKSKPKAKATTTKKVVKAGGMSAEVSLPKKTAPKNGDANKNAAKQKAKEAALRAAKGAAKQKAAAASERATENIKTEATPE